MRNSENQIMKGHILLNDESPTELSKDKNLMLNSKSRLRWTITWLTWSKNSTTWFNGPSFLLHSIGEKTTISILKNLDNFFIKKVTFVDRLLSKKIQVELFEILFISFERWIKGIWKFSSQIIFTNFKSQVKSSFKVNKNDIDIAWKHSNFWIENRLFIICVGETVGGHPPAKN